MIKMSVSPECNLMMTGLLESIACFPCTVSLKSASSCVDIRLSMELTFCIDNSWQYLSVDRHRLVVLSVFNVSLLLSISQLKKSLINWDLFPFSCRKALVSRILTFADLRIVNDPSRLAALGELSKRFSCNCLPPDLLFRNLSEWWIVLGWWTLLVSRKYLQLRLQPLDQQCTHQHWHMHHLLQLECNQWSSSDLISQGFF